MGEADRPHLVDISMAIHPRLLGTMEGRRQLIMDTITIHHINSQVMVEVMVNHSHHLAPSTTVIRKGHRVGTEMVTTHHRKKAVKVAIMGVDRLI